MTRRCLEHPRATLLVVALLTVIAAAGAVRMRTEVGYHAFLGPGYRPLARFDAFVDRYGGGLPMAAVYRCGSNDPCKSVLDPFALDMAYQVVRSLSSAPGVRSVESPATSRLVVAGPFGPEIRRFVEFGAPVRDRDTLARFARSDPLWSGSLLSPDLSTGAIVVSLTSSSSDDSLAAYQALDHALAPYREQGFTFALVGGPVEFVVAGGELKADVARLLPVMIALIGITLLAIFHSWRQAAAALATVGIAVLWTFGLMGWLDWPQTTMTQIIGPMILVIGVCDGIHLVARYAEECARRGGTDRRTALLDVVAEIGTSCFMTSITTAAGMLSFVASGLASVVRLGAIAALGVMGALVLTFTLLPVLLLWMPQRDPVARSSSLAWRDALGGIVDVARRRRAIVLSACAMVAIVCIVGATRLRTNATFEDLYGRDSRVVRWAAFVRDHLHKPDTLEVELQLPPDTVLTAPENLAFLERVETRLAAIPGFGRGRSLASILAHLRSIAAAEAHSDSADQAEPADATENERLMAQFASFDPGALARWVSADRRHVRISVEADKPPQDQLRAMLAGVRHALRADLPGDWKWEVTGPLAIVQQMIDALRHTLLTSFALTFAIVFLLMAVFLRSVRWGLLAMVPTALPVVGVLGFMGMAGVILDPGSALVAAVVLGIAVDDTIHLLHHQRLRMADGESAVDAIRVAVLQVGRAVVTTSLALALGFFALTLSAWRSVADFGAIAAVAILCALAATLVVLPALVAAFHPLLPRLGGASLLSHGGSSR